MANTYTLISSNVLSASAASVTFSAIPSTYTDLVLRTSLRSNRGAPSDDLYITLNGVGGTSYSTTILGGESSGGPFSIRFSSSAEIRFRYAVNGDTSTASTFASAEWYLPNYLSSTNKPSSGFGVTETNATANAIETANAGLARITSAITSITLTPSTNSFLTDSSFYLYGIKKN